MDLTIIQNKIYEIRGERVILDRDLAGLYQVTTGNLNKAGQTKYRPIPCSIYVSTECGRI